MSEEIFAIKKHWEPNHVHQIWVDEINMTKFHNKINLNGAVLTFKHAYANGIGLFDIWYEEKEDADVKDTERNYCVAQVDLRISNERNIFLQSVQSYPKKWSDILHIDASKVVNQNGESAIDYTDSGMGSVFCNALKIGHSVYCFIKLHESKVPAYKTPAIGVKERRVGDLVYTAIDNDNAPGDLIVIYNCRNAFVLDEAAYLNRIGVYPEYFEDVD